MHDWKQRWIEQLPELIGQIVDIYEDLLDDKKIFIPNKDREIELKSMGLTDTHKNAELLGMAMIYGSDYDKISGPIENYVYSELEDENCISLANYPVNFIPLMEEVFHGFLEIVKNIPCFYQVFTMDDYCLVMKKMSDIFTSWSLYL